jgi:hypothetical protein
MKYITPVVLFMIMVWWFIKDAIPTLLLYGVEKDNLPYIWGARIMMLILLLIILYLIKIAWEKQKKLISFYSIKNGFNRV